MNVFSYNQEREQMEEVRAFLDEHMPSGVPWIMLFQLSNGDSMTLRAKGINETKAARIIQNFAKPKS